MGLECRLTAAGFAIETAVGTFTMYYATGVIAVTCSFRFLGGTFQIEDYCGQRGESKKS